MAEIPNPNVDPVANEAVKQFMMHGPCGSANPKSPCMMNDLLVKYQSHLNVEWCNRSRSIKYLLKYINKGSNRATVVVEENLPNIGSDGQETEIVVDETKAFLDYEHPIIYPENTSLDNVLNIPGIEETKFTEWMKTNDAFEDARELTYAEFPTKWVWHSSRNFKELRTINDVTYPTYKDACYALGLLDDDKEWHDSLIEASSWASGQQLRQLFVTMLLFCEVADPLSLWESNWKLITEDILNRQRRILQFQELILSNDQLRNYGLYEIEQILQQYGRSLRDYPQMPQPNMDLIQNGNRLIQEEMLYDVSSLKREHEILIFGLNNEQRIIYNSIMEAVATERGGMFFIYGHGGTGKTYLYRTILYGIRSKGKITLAVASSGIAALLLPGGRTAHSRFHIPINVNDDSTCDIKQRTQVAELLSKTSNGELGEGDGDYNISIPSDLIIQPSENPMQDIIDNTYPVHEYLSSDSICKASSNVPDQDLLYTVEFLNTLRFPRLPNHKLTLKIGSPIMLLRNLNQNECLCNGTRLIITRLATWVIEAEIITGTNIGKRVFIPRITLSPSDSEWPFVLKR
ncbi:uncharacterized protein LOC126721546 [Quercus robur]|uniref:uncharacterized protein LOC126721546 n=1 Tax=Quercus robur TaxID=38942 RepID=UPI0021617FF0|nr:uncharacterized protein LOC126721546 [Quercus robur]